MAESLHPNRDFSIDNNRAIEDAIVSRHRLISEHPSLAADPSNRHAAVAQWIASWLAASGWNRQKVGTYLRNEAARLQEQAGTDEDSYIAPVSFQLLMDIVEGMR